MPASSSSSSSFSTSSSSTTISTTRDRLIKQLATSGGGGGGAALAAQILEEDESFVWHRVDPTRDTLAGLALRYRSSKTLIRKYNGEYTTAEQQQSRANTSLTPSLPSMHTDFPGDAFEACSVLCIAKKKAKKKKTPSASKRADLAATAISMRVARTEPTAEERIKAEREFVAAVERENARTPRSLLARLASLIGLPAAPPSAAASAGVGEARYYLRGGSDVKTALERRAFDLSRLDGADAELRTIPVATALVEDATAAAMPNLPMAVSAAAAATPAEEDPLGAKTRAALEAWRAASAATATRLCARGLITAADLASVERRLQ